MRVRVTRIINGTTSTVHYLCDDATATQILREGGVITFVNGRDAEGPIDVLQGSDIVWIERRPSASDDQNWLMSRSRRRE